MGPVIGLPAGNIGQYVRLLSGPSPKLFDNVIAHRMMHLNDLTEHK
jgi:hypothetical protein